MLWWLSAVLRASDTKGYSAESTWFCLKTCLDDLCKLHEKKHSIGVEKEFHSVAHSACYLYKSAKQ
jgi:hypothetical protein